MATVAAWQCAFCDYRNDSARAACDVCDSAFDATVHRVVPLPPENFASAEALARIATRARAVLGVEASARLGACLVKADSLLEWMMEYQGARVPLREGIPLDFVEALLKSLVPAHAVRNDLIDYLPHALGRTSEIAVVRGPSGRRALMWREAIPAEYDLVTH